jgi:hypothetical protein
MQNELDFFTTLTSALQELNKQIQELNNRKNKTIYTNKEMMELLDASSATLKKWRDEGELSYSLIGATYYYSNTDVENFLRNHHYEAYAYSS